MLRDNLVGLIEPMFTSAGAYPFSISRRAKTYAARDSSID